ncbi:alpha/beta hydrolase fold domain-containing protein [Isoptericola sp. b490]|uniref:alpha/beta hydrolase n=1 Tax=Actinotalea lenta TaxID=3064654 RepID=UPI002713AD39|nr:alpha/beta hydrolase fold domain-containing protein [Isoptericola sp. b490]MDO8119829.1 alpha/beta hydrolase fold domain-containing protein [Isoptericola sp. b490]
MPLEPTLAARLPLLDDLTTWDPQDPKDVARIRQWERDTEPYEGPDVPTRDVQLTAGASHFRVRVYGAGAGTDPCLVWVHGGAFAYGDLEMNEADLVSRELVARTGGVVVSVDYSLVPHVTYPVPHRQVAAAVRWAVEHAAELGVDPRRVSLGGASAGGALSLAAARELHAAGGVEPACLVLAYPVAHHRWRTDPEQERLMTGLPPLVRFPPEAIAGINDDYVASHDDPRWAFVDLDPDGPVAAVTGLPPALVLVCEYDDLRTSAELLVEQAADAGWPVERRLCAGMLHGHLNRTPVLDEVAASLDAIARVVREGTIDSRRV